MFEGTNLKFFIVIEITESAESGLAFTERGIPDKVIKEKNNAIRIDRWGTIEELRLVKNIIKHLIPYWH